MAAGNFGGLVADGPLVNGTALVATSSEALWAAALYSPIPVGPGSSSRPGKKYELRAGGILTTAASAATITITPSIGTAVGGATLGASITTVPLASMTNVAWFLHAILDIRTQGLAGANGTAMLSGCFWAPGTTTNASPSANIVLPFGGTSAAIDTTIASGLTIAKTLSVAGSVTVMNILWTDWN